MNPPVLELHEATVLKDDRPVLDNVSLTIPRGEHTAIVGPNGAGKSILVSLLTHFERPVARTSGVPPVRVFGKDNWDVFELRSQIGIVSADLHNRFVSGNSEGRITAMTAVVSAFLASHGILRYRAVSDEMRTRAKAALDRAGVGHLARRTLDQMSSGEARRVMLARALVTSPQALVLDEPTTGLDLVARHDFLERVRETALAGTTLILITHHIEEIVPEISRIVLLREGRIIRQGAKPDVLTAPSLSELFGMAVAMDQVDGYVYARPAVAGPGVSGSEIVTRRAGCDRLHPLPVHDSRLTPSCSNVLLHRRRAACGGVPPFFRRPSMRFPATRPLSSAAGTVHRQHIAAQPAADLAVVVAACQRSRHHLEFLLQRELAVGGLPRALDLAPGQSRGARCTSWSTRRRPSRFRRPTSPRARRCCRRCACPEGASRNFGVSLLRLCGSRNSASTVALEMSAAYMSPSTNLARSATPAAAADGATARPCRD